VFQLWHCAAAVEDQVLKLSAEGIKLVPRVRFRADRGAIIDLVSEGFVEVLCSELSEPRNLFTTRVANASPVTSSAIIPPMPDFGSGKDSEPER